MKTINNFRDFLSELKYIFCDSLGEDAVISYQDRIMIDSVMENPELLLQEAPDKVLNHFLNIFPMNKYTIEKFCEYLIYFKIYYKNIEYDSNELLTPLSDLDCLKED